MDFGKRQQKSKVKYSKSVKRNEDFQRKNNLMFISSMHCIVTAKVRVEATGSQVVSEEAAKIKSHGGFRKDEGEQSQKEAEADI